MTTEFTSQKWVELKKRVDCFRKHGFRHGEQFTSDELTMLSRAVEFVIAIWDFHSSWMDDEMKGHE